MSEHNELTSSAAASPAKTSPLPARASDSLVQSPASGLNSPASFAFYDRDTSSWKTSQRSLLGDSIESSVTLPKRGTMRSGRLYELPTLAPRTAASGSSWSRGEYPTPRAEDYGSSQNGAASGHVRPTNGTPSLSMWARDAWATPAASDGDRTSETYQRGNPTLLGDARSSRATPTARDGDPRGGKEVPHTKGGTSLRGEAESWPTASATDYKGSARKGQRRGQLSEAAECLWPTPRAEDSESSGAHRGTPDTLTSAARLTMDLWPTPTANEATGYMSGSKSDTWRPSLASAAAGKCPTRGRPAQTTPKAGNDGSTPEDPPR